MKLLIFQNPYKFLSIFLRLWKYFFEKNWGLHRAIFGWITQKILVCDMKSCDKNLNKIRNVTFTCKNIQIFKNVKIIEKIRIGSKKLINSFKIKIKMGHKVIYGNFFFCY